jgi:hypothetical protein
LALRSVEFGSIYRDKKVVDCVPFFVRRWTLALLFLLYFRVGTMVSGLGESARSCRDSSILNDVTIT